MEEIKPKEIEKLHQDMIALSQELRQSLEDFSEGAKIVDLDSPIGRLTRMDALQQQSMTKANRQSIELRLKQVEAALLRYAQSDYGFCLACGESVGLERLKVKPEAHLCIACQNQLEKRPG